MLVIISGINFNMSQEAVYTDLREIEKWIFIQYQPYNNILNLQYLPTTILLPRNSIRDANNIGNRKTDTIREVLFSPKIPFSFTSTNIKHKIEGSKEFINKIKYKIQNQWYTYVIYIMRHIFFTLIYRLLSWYNILIFCNNKTWYMSGY